MSTTTQQRPREASFDLDQACADAVELARSAARDVAGDSLGDYLRCEAVGDRLATHLFASRAKGYVGWCWAVNVVRAPRTKTVTVNEVVQVPGPDALLAPAWLPWSERLRPGDLGVGDLLPAPADDERLVPAYLYSDDLDLGENEREIGIGRLRVMSRHGRQVAAERWYEGEGGPDTPIAREAPGRCGTCGFFLPLVGVLGTSFGACGNELSPSDGRVVSIDHGCGAHSEGVAVNESSSIPGANDGRDGENGQ